MRSGKTSAVVLHCVAIAASIHLLHGLAHADTGRWNLHVDPGVAFPPIGFFGDVGFDWQFARGFALDVRGGGGFVYDEVFDRIVGIGTAAVGVRFRFWDDGNGYANEPGGHVAGDFWLAPHLGCAFGESFGMVFDTEVGYELSVVNPVSIGLFARPAVGFSFDGSFTFMATAGVTISVEFEPLRDPDSDGDGVPDRHDDCPGTVPEAPVDRRGCERDGDADGVVDRLDRCPGTPPGAPVDEQGCELDTDGDGVVDSRDACPGTPPGSNVDERGCVIMERELVLDGIEFAYDSADITPESESVLRVGAQMLIDNPDVRVEVGGHTDDQGSESYNMELSQARAQAVADWLVAHGVARDRLEVRGYGATRPRVPNTSEAARAQNRRIEFRQLEP